MKKRLLLSLGSIALLTAAYERASVPATMSDAAHAYLNSLNAELRSRAVIPFAADERENWHYIPLDNRKGVALREMTSAQKHLAEALVSAGLSQQGVIRAHTIMSLEDVLKIAEKGKGPERDPEKYFLTIFGDPSEQGTWGYRFEGHHVSLNFSVVNGHVASSPSFFGANPETVKDGPRAGLRALAAEEDLGRELIKALTDEQRAVAIVDKAGYKEILTSDSRKAALSGQPNGLPFAKFSAKQKELLNNLVADYAANFPPPVAETRLDKFRKTQDKLFFAWSGGIERGQPHYYRIQTPAILIEFDDTQDNANHIHSVWRDFNGDFGLDLLAQHYQQSH
jgi:hypothetical protein